MKHLLKIILKKIKILNRYLTNYTHKLKLNEKINRIMIKNEEMNQINFNPQFNNMDNNIYNINNANMNMNNMNDMNNNNNDMNGNMNNNNDYQYNMNQNQNQNQDYQINRNEQQNMPLNNQMVHRIEILARGGGLRGEEINCIINSTVGALNKREDPLSKGIINKLISRIGGDWVIFASINQLKGYDLSVSTYNSNKILDFLIDNFRIQVIKTGE